jgi:hypothetical protein
MAAPLQRSPSAFVATHRLNPRTPTVGDATVLVSSLIDVTLAKGVGESASDSAERHLTQTKSGAVVFA